MKFNSQICTTIKQSERLLALGQKRETADMNYQIQYLDLGGVLKECTPNERFYSNTQIRDNEFNKLIETLSNYNY